MSGHYTEARVKDAYERLVTDKVVILDNGCVISTRTPRAQRPWIKSHNRKLSAARVVLHYHGDVPHSPWLQASHLCGQRRCINYEHLAWEAPGPNTDRVMCHEWGQECIHDPPCVPFDPHVKKLLTVIQNDESLDRGVLFVTPELRNELLLARN